MNIDGEAVPVGLLFPDVKAAVAVANKLAIDLERYALMLGASALSSTAQAELSPVGDRLTDGVIEIIRVIDSFEPKEPFGSDESYWNSFRLFCTGDNLGLARSVDEVFGHLALTFDMTNEDNESIRSTLLEWKPDIEADATDRMRIIGRFDEVETDAGNRFVFYKIRDLQPVKSPASTEKRSVTKDHIPSASRVQTVTVIPEQDVRESIILNVLDGNQGPTKQATFLKRLLNDNPELSHSEILALVNNLAVRGLIHKFRPSGDGPAYLSIEPQAEIKFDKRSRIKSPEKNVHLNYDLMGKICKILLGSKLEIKQKIATSQMIHTINEGSYRSEVVSIGELNRAARYLKDKGLIISDIGTPLKGKGKAKSRAKSRESFRVGFGTAESKQKLRELIASGKLQEYLEGIDTGSVCSE